MGSCVSDLNNVYSPLGIKVQCPTVHLGVTHCRRPDRVKITKEYLTHWANRSQDIIWDVRFNNVGPVSIELNISEKIDDTQVHLELELDGQTVSYNIPSDIVVKKPTLIFMGSVNIQELGDNAIRLRSRVTNRKKGNYGRLHFVQLTGPAVLDIGLNSVFGLCHPASDVHVIWVDEQEEKETSEQWLFNRISVTGKRQDARFVACGFTGGYLGWCGGTIEYSVTNRWEGKRPSSKNNQGNPHRYQVQVLAHGDGINVHHNFSKLSVECSLQWNKDIKDTIDFLVKAKATKMTNSVSYSAWAYLGNTWHFLATYKVMYMGQLFPQPFCGIEACKGFHGTSKYSAIFGPVWRKRGSDWVAVTQTCFKPIRTMNRLHDIDATVVEGGRYQLFTGGDTKLTCDIGDLLRSKVADDHEVPQHAKDVNENNA